MNLVMFLQKNGFMGCLLSKNIPVISQKNVCLSYFSSFFLSEFSSTNMHESQDCR